MPVAFQIEFIVPSNEPIEYKFEGRNASVLMLPLNPDLHSNNENLLHKIADALERDTDRKPELNGVKGKAVAVYMIVRSKNVDLEYQIMLHLYTRKKNGRAKFWGVCHYRDGEIFGGDNIDGGIFHQILH